MNWFYLDPKGATAGPVLANLILTKYYLKTGEITPLTKIWNVGRGVKQWTELKNVYSLLVDDIVGSIPRGAITKRLLFSMMNPYHVYVYKTKQYPHNALPLGQARVNIEYKTYLANTLEHESNAKSLEHFLQNRESVILGAKKNPFGLDMALYKIREGEQCSVYIPWRLAYGDKGAMNLIPPKTDILFVITLHKIEKQGTTWQHNKIRLDKWSKMRAKWNAQKASTNVLHITDNYPLAPVNHNKNHAPPQSLKQLPAKKRPSDQAILPMRMKSKPMKPAPVIQVPKPNAMNAHRSIEDQWKDLDHSPHSQPNTPIVSPPEERFHKPPAHIPKRIRSQAPTKKLQVSMNPNDNTSIPPPPGSYSHRATKSEGIVMEEIAAQFAAEQSAHHRQMTSYTPTPLKTSEQQKPTLMLSFSQAATQAIQEDTLPEQQPAFVNQSQTWHSDSTTSERLPAIKTRNRTKSTLDFEQWLKDHKIPNIMIQKLMDGGIMSWEELNAIEDDVELVATELGLTALHKIKLKALLRKLPSKPNESEVRSNSAPPKQEPEPVSESVPPPPKEPQHVAAPQPNPEPVPPPPKQPEPDPDDPRYLKSQIAFLKEENLKLKKLSDATECKQQVREAQDAWYTKDVELQTMQKRLEEECKKVQDGDLKCRQLEQLLRLKETQNNMDIQQTLYSNYCESVNQWMDAIGSSSSQLDKKALDAMEDMKQSMNANAVLLRNHVELNHNEVMDHKKNIKDLKALMPGITHDADGALDHEVLLLRKDSTNDVMHERKCVHIALSGTMERWLSRINTQKAIFEHQLSAIIANKYNEIFYKHFVQHMSLMFYDAKVIRSQFVQSNNQYLSLFNNGKKEKCDAVLCKDGEKVLFDVPLTVTLLSVIRNEANQGNMVYDILCLDHFTRNMMEFESDVVYNDALRFSCLMGIHLCKSKLVQNMIKLSKQSGKDMNKIGDNLKQKATLLSENLVCLIATGYAVLIVDVAQKDSNYEWDTCIECLANLCLSHPMVANANRRFTAPNDVKQAVSKENLNKILMAIATDELKQIINDYFNHFGTVEFIDKIIHASRLHR